MTVAVNSEDVAAVPPPVGVVRGVRESEALASANLPPPPTDPELRIPACDLERAGR